MKRFLFFGLVFVFATGVFAQDWRTHLISANDAFANADFEKARKSADAAYENAKSSNYYDSHHPSSMFEISDIYYRLNDLKTSSKCLVEALKSLKSQKRQKGELYIQALQRVGHIKFHEGKYLLSQKSYQEAERISKDVFGKTSEQYLISKTYVCKSYLLQGQFGYAETMLSKALTTSDETFGAFSKQSAIVSLHYSDYFLNQGRNSEAEVLIRKAVHILEKDKRYHYSEALQNFGRLNLALRNFEVAQEYFVKARESYKTQFVPGHPATIALKRDFGSLYLQAGYPDEALKYIEDAANDSEKLHEGHIEFALVKGLHGKYFTLKKDFENSAKKFDEASASVVKIFGEKHFLYATFQNELGNDAYARGDYDKAIEYYKSGLNLRKELLNIDHPDYLNSITSLSLVYWAKRDMKQASKYFLRSVENFKRQYKSQFIFLSEREKTLFYAGIREFFDKFNSFALDYANEKPKAVSWIYNNQLVSKGLLYNSTKSLRESIVAKPKLFEKWNRFAATKELLSRAYNVSDMASLSSRNINIDSLENVANLLEKELSFRIEESKTMEERMKELEELSLSWEDVQSSLGRFEGAVEIVRTIQFKPENGGSFGKNSRYIALAISRKTRKHPELIIFEDGNLLETKGMKKYRNAIVYQIKDKKSYERYWKPIAESKTVSHKYCRKVFVAPDGTYNNISLNTLQNMETEKFVFDEKKIQIVSNTKDVLALNDSKKQNLKYTKALLIGYPNYNEKKVEGLELAPSEHKEVHTRALPSQRGFLRNFLRGGKGIDQLPGTKKEVEKINEIMIASNKAVSLKINNDADEEVLKETKNTRFSPSIIHISTHGYFSQDPGTKSDTLATGDISLKSSEVNPLTLSGVLLSGATFSFSDLVTEKALDAWAKNESLEDGNLTAYEAMNLNLFNTDLVVLSACETGLGVVKNGEGVYGLQRSFQTAGAKSVIMSLWKVDDQATKDFMVYFYESYNKSGDKREAFRFAREELRKKYPHPYYWGAFVMVGE